MPQAAEAARAQPQAQAKAGAGDPIRERAAASANAAAPARDQAGNAAAETADGLGTADSPAVRDAWLRRIGELLAEGKADDAKASLAEFRRRYPEATLPPELRTLEP